MEKSHVLVNHHLMQPVNGWLLPMELANNYKVLLVTHGVMVRSGRNRDSSVLIAGVLRRVEPRIDIMLHGGAKERLGKTWAKWFHANDILGRKADCLYFVAAVKLSQQLGEGVVVPRGRDIDGPLLYTNYEDLQTRMDQYKEDWGCFGVTIMLHAMMKEKIGGELVRWNATRVFGTDKFQVWMVSSDWKNNDWRDDEDHKFTYDCLIDRIWWEKVEMVLKTVTPLYSVLRFADQQKMELFLAFFQKTLSAQAEIFAKLKHDKNVKGDFMKKVNEIIKKRTQYLLNDTLMVAGAALDPKSFYT
ncbi:hypothetical protein Zm00014a_027205 [Zea mays]|uniref:Uncharacterized protein n=1 Tax=Zea mays TaxID=4577 RepID=A0A3L6DAW8_MAIZE|nr:hypothetical protein Zm00014a_027205 [Zea mays]